MTSVVDASVVLAWLQDEPGADEAEPHLMEGVIGAANWSEVLQKTRQHGAPAKPDSLQRGQLLYPAGHGAVHRVESGEHPGTGHEDDNHPGQHPHRLVVLLQ